MFPEISVAASRRLSSKQAIVLATLFLTLSLVLSLAFLSVRNIYDDEHSSLTYVNQSTSKIIAGANSADVHPPGMYLLAHYSYRAIPSTRWMTLFPLLFVYAGLATFVFSIAPLFRTLQATICFSILATLHPQLLMWSNTIRWYSWWIGLALITLVVALRPRAPETDDAKPKFTLLRAASLGILFAVLFYLNYITFIFVAALSVCIVIRYSWTVWKHSSVTLAIFAALILPQLHPFLTVHTAGSKEQRANIALSFARLIQATLGSEAYLPWHPLCILAILALSVVVFDGGFRLWKRYPLGRIFPSTLAGQSGLASIVLFSLIFFALVAASGLGGKPRNGLLLIPALAPLYALCFEQFQSKWLRTSLLIIFGVWCAVGAEHLVRRHGLAKSNMNNHPEEVVSFLRTTQGGSCSMLVTYDALLALTAVETDGPNVLVLTSTQSSIFVNAKRPALAACNTVSVNWAQSYTGGMGAQGDLMSAEIQSSVASIQGPLEVHRFSYDPDAASKRKLAFISGAATLPDYRYTVFTKQVPASDLSTVLGSVPHFVLTDGVSKPLRDFSTLPK